MSTALATTENTSLIPACTTDTQIVRMRIDKSGRSDNTRTQYQRVAKQFFAYVDASFGGSPQRLPSRWLGDSTFPWRATGCWGGQWRTETRNDILIHELTHPLECVSLDVDPVDQNI